jgi:glycosyltransferase involved in cell wall biosynthesis
MDLSIIIPTYSRSQLLPLVIESWQERIPEGVSAELVIVDDGSTDDTPHVLRELAERWQSGPAQIHAVRQENLGRSAARNRGIEVSTGGVLLFSDDDMVPRSTDFITLHLKAQSQDPGASVSRLVIPDSAVTTPFQAYWRRRLQGGNADIPSGKDLGKGGFWFATLSIPRDVLGQQRFSDEFHEYGWEEHELGYRLHGKGVRARFLREALVEHHDAVDFEGTLRKYRQMGRSAWVFHHLHPTLEISIWTGTHPVSRALRRLVGQERRGARLLERDPSSLTDAHYLLCLEAAYAEGLSEGGSPRESRETGRPTRLQEGSQE